MKPCPSKEGQGFFHKGLADAGSLRKKQKAAAGTCGEDVAGARELILDLQSEMAELAAIEAESIGWLPLGDGAYLHVGDPEALVIEVVGVPDAAMAGMNVLLVG